MIGARFFWVTMKESDYYGFQKTVESCVIKPTCHGTNLTGK